LRDKLERGIIEGFPDAFVFFNDQERLPNVTAIAFPGVANESLLFCLNRLGVYACIGGGTFQQLGILLEASGVDPVIAHTAVSFSLSRQTTELEIDKAVSIIVEEAIRLRNLSIKLV